MRQEFFDATGQLRPKALGHVAKAGLFALYILRHRRSAFAGAQAWRIVSWGGEWRSADSVLDPVCPDAYR
jgi:hypothetical protein